MALRTDGPDQADAATATSMDDAWQRQQIKAFTAWVNGHLRKRGVQVANIQTDFSDGKRLLDLLEIIGDAQLPKPAKGAMRIHKVQNVNAAFKFISEKGVKLVSIGAEEIVDGNLKMILGMLWTLILRFDIQDISVEELSAKDALLLWCQRKTQPYSNVDVQNFHMSWKDGLAFCALIHRHRPDLLNFDKLRKDQPLENLRLACTIAEKELDIPPMIDPEDIVSCIKPDERSIMTQVAAYYKCFAGAGKNAVAAAKIATVLNTNREHERLIDEYETRASDLLKWIPTAIARLEQRPPLHSVEDCQSQLHTWNGFRSSEYPPKLDEKGDLEAHYSTLQTKLRLSGRPAYVPSEGKLIENINQAWGGLDAADVANKHWVLDELKRNQLCAQKAASFHAKASSHESWTGDKAAELGADDYSSANLAQLSALKKKHQAFQSDFTAREVRVHEIGTLANELDDLRYADADTVNTRYATIYETWQTLAQLSEARQAGIEAAEAKQLQLDELRLQFAKTVAPFNTFLDQAQDNLTAGYLADTEDDVRALQAAQAEFKAQLQERAQELAGLQELDAQMQQLGSTENAYTSHTLASITAKWDRINGETVPQRDAQLATEAETQAAREGLRRQWAQLAQQGSDWISARNEEVNKGVESSDAKLEAQLASLQGIAANMESFKPKFDELEALNKHINEALVLDNPHSTLTMEIIRGLWYKLNARVKRLDTELRNQILTRDSKGISEEQMREYRDSFAHFDKDNSKKLDKLEFRACLISLGYAIPQKPEGEDVEFNRVLARVDQNGNGYVTFDEFIAFMAEEQADAETSSQLLAAFKVLAGDKPYVLADELRRDLPPELAQYCLDNMAPFEGGPAGALDYKSFSSALYGETDV